jgi:hypothetical protein
MRSGGLPEGKKTFPGQTQKDASAPGKTRFDIAPGAC